MKPRRFLAVRNWPTYQHYHSGQRAPIWIKLYNSILEDWNYLQLGDAARSHLLGIFLLASRLNNRIPYDDRYIANAIQARSRVHLGPLIASGFLEEVAEDARLSASIVASTNGALGPVPASILASGFASADREGEGEQHSPYRPGALAFRGQVDPTPDPTLAAAVGVDGWPAVADYLRNARPDTWLRWQREMLRIIGPATGLVAEDLVGALTDALLVDPPAKSPTALRAFALRRRDERRQLEAVVVPDAEQRVQVARAQVQSVPRPGAERTGAGLLLATIRELKQHVDTPGAGRVWFIRQSEVDALGPRAAAAYRAVGGSDRVLGTRPDQLGILLRDFTDAYNSVAPQDRVEADAQTVGGA